MRRVKMADETRNLWSRLPKDILLLIDKRLNTSVDTLRLRSVCSSWRSSVPLFKKSPPLPLNLGFPSFPLPARFCNRIPNPAGHYWLLESSIFFFLPLEDQTVHPKPSTSKGSTNIWLLRVEELGNGKFRPCNLLSKILTKKVVRNFPNLLNLMNVRVFEVAKTFSLEFVETSKNIDPTLAGRKPRTIHKVVVSPSPITPNRDDFELAVIYGGKLGFMKLGDENWSLVDASKHYHDVAYYKGKFYAVDHSNRTVVFGSGPGFDLKEGAPPVSPDHRGRRFKYLVVSKAGLFMVEKYLEIDDKTWANLFLPDIDYDVEVVLKVYKLNEEMNEWEFVDSLGDEVFFVGKDCNYCVSVHDFPGLKRNCIYFLDNEFGDNEGSGDLCVNFGVYRMKDGKSGGLESFKGHSKFFWPPPAWLNSDPRPL